ncbi:MAG: GDSL-type esterase/lipase family protein [Burkholderiaceae bacterium]
MKARHLPIALFCLLSLTCLHGCGSSDPAAAPAATGDSHSAAQGASLSLASLASASVADAPAPAAEPVVAQPDASQTATEPTPEAPAPGPANPLLGRTIKVMALGDSMTAGDEAASNGFRSYRGTLYRLLVDQGHQPDFVGSRQSQPAVGGDPDHEGYGGAYIGPGGAASNLADKLPAILAAHEADIIILAFGWNSVFNEGALAGAKYRDIVERIAAARPQAHLVLATLSPMRNQDEAASAASLVGYRDLNATARSLAARSATDRLHLADFAAGGFQPADYWDVIHWLQPGADRAAHILFEAIQAGPLGG